MNNPLELQTKEQPDAYSERCEEFLANANFEQCAVACTTALRAIREIAERYDAEVAVGLQLMNEKQAVVLSVAVHILRKIVAERN